MQQENIYLPDSQTPPPLIACIGGQLVLPPLSPPADGDPVRGNPPQTITQSLISHMKESSESFTLTVVGKRRQNLVFRPEALPGLRIF